MRKPSATYRFAASLACLAMLGPFAIDTYLPAFSKISYEFGVPFDYIQQTLTYYIIAFAIMNLVHGVLSDAIGRRPVILACLTVFSFASLGCAIADRWQTLFLFRIFQGASAGAGVVIAHAIGRDCFDGADARRMVAYGAVTYSIAPALAPVIGGYLLNGYGWRSIFVFLMLLSALMLFLSWFRLPETHPPHLRQPLAIKSIFDNYHNVLSRPDFHFLTSVSAFNFSAGFLYIASSSTFLMRHLGVSTGGFAWLFLPLISGNMLGTFLSGKRARHWPPVVAVKHGYHIMLLAAASNLILCLMATPKLPWNIVPLFVYTIGMALAAPSVITMLLDKFPTLRGTASSLRWFTQNMLLAVVAGVISPLVSTSVTALAMAMLVMLLISFFCWTLFCRKEIQKSNPKLGASHQTPGSGINPRG